MSAILAHDWFPRPLPRNVELGERSWLYSSFAFIHCRSGRPAALRLGRSSGIYNAFFDLGPEGEVAIGEYCTLVDVIIASNGRVSVGDYCFLSHEVVIADSPHAMPWRDGDTRTTHSGTRGVVLEDDVWIGAGAILLGGARIGAGSIVGSGAVVDFEVPRDVIVAGNPARVVGPTERRT
jgi:acetyltransferase-like isoleucine patch superfamily enzyme